MLATGRNGRKWECVEGRGKCKVYFTRTCVLYSTLEGYKCNPLAAERAGRAGAGTHCNVPPKRVQSIGGGILHPMETAEGQEGAVLFILVQSQKIPNPFSPNAFKATTPLPYQTVCTG